MTIAISVTHPKQFFGLVRRVSQTLRVKRSFLDRFVRFSRPAVAYAYSVYSCTLQPEILTINISLRFRVSNGLVYMQ